MASGPLGNRTSEIDYYRPVSRPAGRGRVTVLLSGLQVEPAPVTVPRWFATAQRYRYSGAAALGFTMISTPQNSLGMSTIIVDDEKPARDELAFLLKNFPDVNVIGQGKNGLEAIALIKERNPDLAFLDVKMPGLDGFGVIRKLMERKVKLPHIVFATAYDQYAVQAFEVNAVDYVLKPFDKQRVSRAIERARRAHSAEASPAERLETLVSQLGGRGSQLVKLLVKAQGRLFLVDADEMVCASIEDGTITISTRDLEGVSNYRTIEELVDSLDSDRFWRPHRSHLVNINHIKEVLPWFKSSYILKMADKRQSEVPVSRAQTKRLRELLKM
jgi:two-component system, LytTR family, response regulator LytT